MLRRTVIGCSGIKWVIKKGLADILIQDFPLLKRIFANYTREQLQAVIDDVEIKEACTVKTPKPSFFHSLPRECDDDLVLNLTEDMHPEIMDGIMFVSYNTIEELNGYCFYVKESDRKGNIRQFITMMCEAWLLRTKEKAYKCCSNNVR